MRLSTGYLLPAEALAWILGAVQAMAAHPVREPVNYRPTPPPLATAAIAALPPDQRALVYTLQLRRAFGGMGGDMTMLNWLAEQWARRFQDAGWCRRFVPALAWPVTPIPAAAQPDLALRDWELAGVDFHVSNILPQAQRQGALTAYSLDALKTVMWELSSSTTDKRLAPHVPKGTVDDRFRDRSAFGPIEHDYLDAAPVLAISVFWNTC